MTPDQELLLKIAKWRWPHIDWELAPVGDSLTGPNGEYFVIRTDYIEPIWQEHGQKVIEWKENVVAIKHHGEQFIELTYGETEIVIRDMYEWLIGIATGTAHDKAVALCEWIDATDSY